MQPFYLFLFKGWCWEEGGSYVVGIDYYVAPSEWEWNVDENK